MNWIITDSADRVYEAADLSNTERVLIFKYSHKCVINYTLKKLLEREWNEGEMNMKTYLVNVIDNRDISNDITKKFGVEHQSPQILIIENGKSIASFSHGKVLFSNLKQFAN